MNDTLQMKLDIALSLANRTLAEGRERNLVPLTVAVLDAGGHTVVILRGYLASLLRPQIATGKAWGALGMGFGGRELAQRAATMPTLFNALIELADGRMVPVPLIALRSLLNSIRTANAIQSWPAAAGAARHFFGRLMQKTDFAGPTWYVAQQLGHVDVQMVIRVYVKFIAADYQKPKAPALRAAVSEP